MKKRECLRKHRFKSARYDRRWREEEEEKERNCKTMTLLGREKKKNLRERFLNTIERERKNTIRLMRRKREKHIVVYFISRCWIGKLTFLFVKVLKKMLFLFLIDEEISLRLNQRWFSIDLKKKNFLNITFSRIHVNVNYQELSFLNFSLSLNNLKCQWVNCLSIDVIS